VQDFRQVTDSFWVSPQIGVADIAEAAKLGFALIVNNRPEGESPDQTAGNVIAAAAGEANLAYCAIPIVPGGFSREQVAAMAAALAGAEGPVLAYCRTGTRSTLLWALAQASTGRDPGEIADAAQQAGYDVSPVRAIIDGLSAEAQG
jgi:uncharacterized protein (TIGR01244 family)